MIRVRPTRVKLGLTVLALPIAAVVPAPAHAQAVDTMRIAAPLLAAPTPLRLSDRVTIATGGNAGFPGFRAVVRAGTELAVLFNGVRGAVIVLGSPPAGEIRIYAPDGSGLTRTLGVGQLAVPEWMALGRDSVLVVDRPAPGEMRLWVLRPTGEVLGSRPYRPPPGAFRALAATPGGWLILRQVSSERPTDPRTPFSDSTVVSSFDPASLATGEVLGVPGPARYRLAPDLALSPAFSGQPGVAVGPDGRIHVHRGDGYRIETRTEDGTLLRVTFGEVARTPVSDEELARSLASLRADYQGRLDRAQAPASRLSLSEAITALDQHGTRVGKAEFRPVIGRMLASAGHLMVERLDLADTMGSSVVWDVIALDGTYHGALAVEGEVDPVLFDWPYLTTYRRQGASIERWRIQAAP